MRKTATGTIGFVHLDNGISKFETTSQAKGPGYEAEIEIEPPLLGLVTIMYRSLANLCVSSTKIGQTKKVNWNLVKHTLQLVSNLKSRYYT